MRIKEPQITAFCSNNPIETTITFKCFRVNSAGEKQKTWGWTSFGRIITEDWRLNLKYRKNDENECNEMIFIKTLILERLWWTHTFIWQLVDYYRSKRKWCVPRNGHRLQIVAVLRPSLSILWLSFSCLETKYYDLRTLFHIGK